MARVMPRVDSIPTAAIPMPYRPLEKRISYSAPPVVREPPEARKETMMAMPMMMMGAAVDSIPREMPPMMVVAAPVSVESARFWVGL